MKFIREKNKIMSAVFLCALIIGLGGIVLESKEYIKSKESLGATKRVLKRLKRDNLTPREWRVFKETYNPKVEQYNATNVKRALTVFNNYYLRKKYLQINASDVNVRNFNWRDILNLKDPRFSSIKNDIEFLKDDYNNLFEQLVFFERSQISEQKNKKARMLNSIKNFLYLNGGLLVLWFLLSFIPKRREDVFSSELPPKVIPKRNVKVSSKFDEVWNLQDLIDDFVEETKIRSSKEMEIDCRNEIVFVAKEVFVVYEKALGYISKLLSLLSIKNKLSLRVSQWVSNNKIYLFVDFKNLDFSKSVDLNLNYPDKLLKIERCLIPFGGKVNLYKFNDDGSTRLSVEFNKSLSKKMAKRRSKISTPRIL